jgi:enamine deaminase RidA (YjgF/YER057c/UK114 family)
VADDGRAVGLRCCLEGSDLILLQGISVPPSASDPLSVAVESGYQRTWSRIDQLLRGAGARLNDVVRTWFYVRDIVPHYESFNRARNAFYSNHALLPALASLGPLPASTGIGAAPCAGEAILADVLAIRSAADRLPRRLSSSVQPEATSYGSAFSRAIALPGASGTLVHLSGTAAIGEDGRSLYPGDPIAQIDCTLDKVAALLEPEGASLAQASAVSLFLKRAQDAPLLAQRLRGRGLDGLPAVVMVADICRDELLFEVDAELYLSPGAALRPDPGLRAKRA